MASRSKKKKEILTTKPQIERQQVVSVYSNKGFNSKLSGLIALTLLILVVLLFSVPVVELSLTMDFQSIASEEDDIDLSGAQNQTFKFGASSFKLMMMPIQTKGDFVKYFIRESGLSKNESGEKLLTQIASQLLKPEETSKLEGSVITLLVINYLFALLLIIGVIVALIERNKKEPKFLGVMIIFGMITADLFFEFIFEIVMLINSISNIGVSVGWGMFIKLLIATLMFGYMVYHYVKIKKEKEKAKNETMS